MHNDFCHICCSGVLIVNVQIVVCLALFGTQPLWKCTCKLLDSAPASNLWSSCSWTNHYIDFRLASDSRISLHMKNQGPRIPLCYCDARKYWYAKKFKNPSVDPFYAAVCQIVAISTWFSKTILLEWPWPIQTWPVRLLEYSSLTRFQRCFFWRLIPLRKLTHGLRSFSQVPRVMRATGPQPALMSWPEMLVFKGNPTEGWIRKF